MPGFSKVLIEILEDNLVREESISTKNSDSVQTMPV